MKFSYIGDPRSNGEGPDEVSLYGTTFPKNKAVEVENEALIRKLEGNSHFEAVKRDKQNRSGKANAAKAGGTGTSPDAGRSGSKDGD